MHSEAATSRWRLRWTAISLGVVLLMFVCGIAATGVAHQAGWLIRSEEPMFESRHSSVRVRCISQLREIGMSIDDYAEAHEGHFPDSLASLRESEYSESSACPSQPGYDYIYYGRDLTWPAGEDVPILAEPLANHEGEGMNILFGDGSARFVDADEAEAILARRPR